MNILSKEKPILFFSGGDECREAYLLTLNSEIACEFRPAAEDTPPPFLLDGYTRYIGIEEIRKFIEEYKNRISKQATKKISIETIRYPTENDNEYVSIRGLVSLLSFDMPVKDFNGKENNRLCLKTTWFVNGGGYHWNMWLEGENRGCICISSYFNNLHEHFSSYSKERLKQWQETAIKEHRKYLLKIEDLYWQGGEISKDFL